LPEATGEFMCGLLFIDKKQAKKKAKVERQKHFLASRRNKKISKRDFLHFLGFMEKKVKKIG
jgi:hypothetical protein